MVSVSNMAGSLTTGGAVGTATTTVAIAIPAVDQVARPAGLELRASAVSKVRPGTNSSVVSGLAASRATLDHRHRKRFVGAGVGQTSSRPTGRDSAIACALCAGRRARSSGSSIHLGRNRAHLVNTVQDLSARGVGLRVLAGRGAQIDATAAAGRQRPRRRRSTCLTLA